jgi:hypothetical protein
LSFYGDGRGDNTLTGYFSVLGVTYAGDGTVLSFAAQFTQFDEGNPNAWNNGLIEYNYAVPDAASTFLLLGLALTGCVVFRSRRSGQIPN